MPKKKLKEKVQVSWPQNVVKTVENGQAIERVIDIRNPHERLVPKLPRGVESDRSGARVLEPAPDATTASAGAPNPRRKCQNQRSPQKANHFSPGDIRQSLPALPHVHDVNTAGHSTINTDSVREFMSEPRASWRLSAPRTGHTVSKVRPLKPEVRIANGNTLSEITTAPLADRPQPQLDPAAGNAQPQEGRKESYPFVFPNPIAVKRRAWRYSVDAEEACNREREKHRCSMHGTGFRDLMPYAPVTDPAILERIAEIRRQQQNEPSTRAPNRAHYPQQRRLQGFVNRTSASNGTSNYSQSLTHDLVEHANVSGGLPNSQHQNPTERRSGAKISGPLDPIESLTELEQKIEMREVGQRETTEIAAPVDENPTSPIAHDLRSQPSSLSSNVRTPRSYYGPNYIPQERPAKAVIPKPKMSKAEFGLQQRSGVLSRNPPYLLKAKQELGLGREEETPEGDLWRTAPIVLGQLTYDTITRWRREEGGGVPVNMTRPAPPPILGLAGAGVEYARITSRPHRVLGEDPATPPNSPVPSSFSDLLSTAQYPRRLPETARSFPPPPSQAVPYKKGHHAPVEPTIPEVTDESLQIVRQEGMWHILDKPNHRISSDDAKELLYRHIQRPLDSIEESRRHLRLAKSQSYFSPDYKPKKPQSIPERMHYLVTAFRDLAQETCHPPLSQSHMIYLTRLLSTKEIVPYPIFQTQLHGSLTLFLEAWPIGVNLGLRPLAMLHFLHEDTDIITFVSTEDPALYLWSPEWDMQIFNGAKLVRAGQTLEDCERGIRQGLHILEFEQGGWLKLDGYEDGSSTERPRSRDVQAEEEDIYGAQPQEFMPMQM